MTSNILITFLVSLLTLSGINTTNAKQAITDVNITNESAEVATGDTNYEVDNETENDISDEEDSMSIEEKYERNAHKEDYTEDDGETLIWYDVPYCDNHDFEVLGDETETMYICKKCGYSYSEFHENNDDSNTEPNEENEELDEDQQENNNENTSN